MQAAWPVAITPSGSATVATVTWRQGSRLCVTVVVKATFALVPNETMVPVDPEPIFSEEQYSTGGAPGAGLRAADDLAPYRGQTDVWLTAHAVAAQSPAARSIPVRLALLRDDGAALLDKRLTLEIRAGAAPPAGGAPHRIPIPQMGPLSKRWPIRSQLLGAADPRNLDGPVLKIPEPFDWRYFQAAPADQRIGPLRGDEWLVLEGMHPSLERLAARLPPVRGVARVRGTLPDPERWRPLALVLDALCIDPERRRCSMTWRGHFPVSEERELVSLHVIAGVEPAAAGVSVRSEAPAAAAAPAGRAQEVEAQDPLAGTMALEDGDLIELEEEDLLAGTLGLNEETAAELAERPATPFRRDKEYSPRDRVSASAASAPVWTARAPVAERDPLAGTLGLAEETAAELAARPATPFAQDRASHTASGPAAGWIAPDPAAQSDPLAGTLGLAEETAAELAARPATPFRRGDLSPAVAVLAPVRVAPSPVQKRDPLGGTLGLAEETAAELAARPAIPFEREAEPPAREDISLVAATPARTGPDRLVASPVLPPDLHVQDDAMPLGLGAQFLAAMGYQTDSEPS
jgi:hypothetical protein